MSDLGGVDPARPPGQDGDGATDGAADGGADGPVDGAPDGALLGAVDGSVEGAELGAADDAGRLGATDGATVGATEGAIEGTGVGDDVQAASALIRERESTSMTMARFISDLQGLSVAVCLGRGSIEIDRCACR